MDGKNRGRRNGGGNSNRNVAAAAAAARPPPNTASEAWLHAIQDATECVTPVDRSSSSQQDDIVASLGYLQVLTSILEQHSHDWDEAPIMSPPAMSSPPNTDGMMGTAPVDLAYYTNTSGYQDPPTPAAITVPSWNNTATSNRYATFQTDEDSEDDDESSDLNDEYNMEATSSFTPSPRAPLSTTTTSPSHVHLSMRRLMIRIVTAQSEVYACQASHAPPQWQQGAEWYQISLFHIHSALSLADSECARWLDQGDALPSTLIGDANVVEVAVQYLTQQTDKFKRRALNKQRQLVQRLEPQWQTRDEVKKKWGTERWTNNPHPKRNYAAMRQADEEQLRQIEAALQSLEEMDTQGAVQSSRELRNQVTSSSSSSGKNKKKKSKPRNRTNGQRPTDLSKRVSLSEYPDPTDFGWAFTGSSDDVVEFFENDDGVKLDWYFTTGTVKTSLDHPKQGKTQLFGARVDSNTYLEILLNPRAHTNERYHTQNERKPSRNLWVP